MLDSHPQFITYKQLGRKISVNERNFRGLLDPIAAYRAEGIREMVAVIQNNNVVVWRLMRGLGYPITRRQDGSATEVTLDVSDPPGWEDTAVDYSPEPQLIGY